MKRHSSKRDAIYKALCETDAHPSARQLYERLQPDIPELSQGTVYRVLGEFEEEGKARAVAVVDGVERFDGKVFDHPHFVCRRCKRVIDLPEEKVERYFTMLLDMGYLPERAELTVTGLCETCRKEEPDGKNT